VTERFTTISDNLHKQSNAALQGVINEKICSSVAIGNPERHMRKASHCGSKEQ